MTMNTSAIIFDIETMGTVTAETAVPFNADEVKLGNTKDPDKIAKKIEEARAVHVQQQIERAALSAVTGRVLCIGYYSAAKNNVSIGQVEEPDKERQVIQQFWGFASKCIDEGRRMIGLNIFGFDLPFLRRRSWILGIDVPEKVRNGRYWHPIFIDIADEWLSGDRFGSTSCNFDELARAFGTAGKPAGTNGSHFAELFKTDRQKAIEYLESDIKQPAVWAQRMGLMI